MVKSAVVFGASGQLGAELVREFERRRYRVHAFSRQHVDIADAAAVERALAETRPALALNAAAYNAVDLAEQEPLEASRGNALAVRNIAVCCRASGIRLVHFSTDYVFDGLAGCAYEETDEPRPVCSYGVSKLAGEYYARAYCDDALIIRTAAVFGPEGARTRRGNFVETMLRLAARQSGKPLEIVHDQVTSPAYAPALAARTADLVEMSVTGIVHAGGEAVSWFEFARRIFPAAGLSARVEPIPASSYPTPARRPPYSALRNARMLQLGLTPMPGVNEALADYFSSRS
jgi:dTDP-4-dehydrorhamnose reductase